MNKETRDGLKTNIDAMKNVLNGATAPDAEYIARLMFSLNTWEAIAEAERLLDEGLAPPSRYARVHLMGHTTHVGEVGQLPGGALRINAIDSSHERGVFRYVIDSEQRARHSVEWLSEADWKAHVDALERDHAVNVEERRRRTTLPEGYELVRRSVWPPFGFRVDGKVCGFFADDFEARMEAWEHADAVRDGGVQTEFEDMSGELDNPDDVPCDATAEAPAAETYERLEEEGADA